MTTTSFDKDRIKILLLEGVHERAIRRLAADGYRNVTRLDHALQGDELAAALDDVHMLGIRSRTQLTGEVLDAAGRLMAVGCFCIGTNQVTLAEPLSGASRSSTHPTPTPAAWRSWCLPRPSCCCAASHRRRVRCTKVSGRSRRRLHSRCAARRLGVVGYGNIGSQLGVLAEGLGMNVVFYDVVRKLNLGNARQIDDLNELLEISDVVSLHVPSNPSTVDLMDADAIGRMKEEAVLVNASRGNVVDIGALAERLRTGGLLGAAIDVFPEEPKSNNEPFVSELKGLPNVILTPHIGGSTMEAQENIGLEVAEKLIRYSDNGSTRSAVNFPEVVLPEHPGQHRLLHIHRNAPGVLSAINQALSAANVNVTGQYLQTLDEIGYVVIDVEADYSRDVRAALAEIDGTVRTRVLY